MIDWKSYGPIYTVAPGIKKIEELPIIEFDDQEERYLRLKKKAKENIFLISFFHLSMMKLFVKNLILY
jgi:hypothetical protein